MTSLSPESGLPSIGREIGIVVIGRNEGPRLRACLRSIASPPVTTVYVDSCSTDGSAEYAASQNCNVLQLDGSSPLSAARARNEGYALLMKLRPELSLIQFVDADCELALGWLEEARATMASRPDVAIVCGHIRERDRDASIYNRLCDMGWRQEPGEIRACGGIFLIRAEVFGRIGGFRTEVIAAEDDELCLRVRKLGYKILQLDAEMVRHDVAMTRFSQWWRRSRRTGHAFAQVSAMHGEGEEEYFLRDARKVWLWGLVLPALSVLLIPITGGYSIAALFAAYALQWARIYRRSRQQGWTPKDASLFSFFAIVFKFPALLGMLEYHWNRWHGKSTLLIEYKRSL